MPATRRSRRAVEFRLESLEGRSLLSTLGHHHAEAPAVHVQAAHHAAMHGPTSNRWAWLTDTYWYVPPANLPAIIFDPSSGSLIPVRDQTVYHISGYRNGYFWGETVSQLNTSTPSSSSLVGSVTPQGRVLLSFSSASTVTQGYGEMIRKGGQWTMENQMFSGPTSGTQIGHWAYMVQTHPGMRSWNSLPSVGVSVPTFLSNYSAPTPTPVIGVH